MLPHMPCIRAKKASYPRSNFPTCYIYTDGAERRLPTPPARRRWTTRRFPAPDHETPTNNGALEYLLDDLLPVFWKRLFALTFARVPGHAVAGDEYLARHLGSLLVGDDLLK